MTYNKLYDLILENAIGMDTYWQDGDVKLTIKDVVKYLDNNKVPTKIVSINKIKPIIIDQDYKGVNKDRVQKSNLDYPIIVVKKNGKYKSILDGNHRAFKALDTNKKTIKVREVDLDDPNIPEDYNYLFD